MCYQCDARLYGGLRGLIYGSRVVGVRVKLAIAWACVISVIRGSVSSVMRGNTVG